jgi:hypothetical protein
VRGFFDACVPTVPGAPVDSESLDTDTFPYFREMDEDIDARVWLLPHVPQRVECGRGVR